MGARLSSLLMTRTTVTRRGHRTENRLHSAVTRWTNFKPHAKITVQVLNLTTRQLSTLPNSEGLWSPRWSPNGRFIAALSTDTRTLLIFDFVTQRWAPIADANF